jgi:hypothetical protein
MELGGAGFCFKEKVLWALGVACVPGSHAVSVSWIPMFKPCSY